MHSNRFVVMWSYLLPHQTSETTCVNEFYLSKIPPTGIGISLPKVFLRNWLFDLVSYKNVVNEITFSENTLIGDFFIPNQLLLSVDKMSLPLSVFKPKLGCSVTCSLSS